VGSGRDKRYAQKMMNELNHQRKLRVNSVIRPFPDYIHPARNLHSTDSFVNATESVVSAFDSAESSVSHHN